MCKANDSSLSDNVPTTLVYVLPAINSLCSCILDCRLDFPNEHPEINRIIVMAKSAHLSETFEIANALSPDMIDRTRSIGPQIYEQLRLSIILDKLKPGQPINEQDVCDCLGVSRTPMREAYQKLMNDGLIKTISKVGTVVSEINQYRVEEGIIIRRALEREVVKLLCEIDVDFSELEPTLALQSVAVSQKNNIDFFKHDEEFHQQLAQLAGIPSAWRLAQSVKAHTDRMRIRLTADLPLRINKAFEEHIKLIEALKQHDAELAQALVNQHINSAFEVV